MSFDALLITFPTQTRNATIFHSTGKKIIELDYFRSLSNPLGNQEKKTLKRLIFSFVTIIDVSGAWATR